MKTSAVICEFNPFHNGHKYLLEEIRNQGFDTIICVMSGSFTQRGDVAITDKFSRAETAINNGADLVIELPTPYTVASAERFAKGSVSIINATGIVDKVFFGSESGDIELIKKAAAATENIKVQDVLKELMKNGEYYPSALEKAVEEVFGSEVAQILSSPNNILGVEYVKELAKCGIETGTIKRKDVDHDSKKATENFASASLIREKVLCGEDVSSFVPYCDFNNPAQQSTAERAIIFKLKTMSIEDFKKLPDVKEGLENRIFNAIQNCNSLKELLMNIKTKRYTMARLRRIIASAILSITKDLQDAPIEYLRVLGMTEKGEEALSVIAKKTDLPIITSVAPALNTLEGTTKEMLLCDIRATDIRTVFEKEISSSGRDFTEGLIKQKRTF